MEGQIENREGEAPKMSFEEALSKLENIVYQLENGALSLEDSLAMFEEGMRLSKICGDKLAEAENRIEVLVKRGDGTLGWNELDKPRQ